MRSFIGNLRFIYVVLAVIWFAFKGMVAGLFCDREKFFRKRLGPEGRKILKRLGSTIEIKGLENLNPDENYVIVGNHRSYTDILALFLAAAAGHREVVFMSKKEIFKVPVMGSAMKAVGMIGVERGNSSKAMRSMLEAVDAVKKGRNLVIFPEGTRSSDGRVGDFKRGGFIIAARAGVKVAPFVLKNTEKFMPKGSSAIYKADLYVEFLPTIDTAGCKDTEVMKKAETVIKEKLASLN